jgi:hypothetical protein
VSAGGARIEHPLQRQANAKSEPAPGQPIPVDGEIDAQRSLLLNRRRLVE